MVLGEKLGMAFYDLGRSGFERLGDLCVQSLSGITQQAAVRRVLNKGMFEAVDSIGRNAALRHQLGRNEACQGRLEFVFGQRQTACSKA